MKDNPTFQVHCGNALDILKTLPSESVQCCITSPPYFGLRDYNVKGQLGLERTPEEFVSQLVEVFREVRRVLKDDGTVWLNLGDSYGTGTTPSRKNGSCGIGANTQGAQDAVPRCGGQAKQLLGIPWRVAFALQADGWYLRSEIIWHKPNPMPESVTDRPTKSHEQIFLLSKSAKYFYDADAIAEPLADANAQRTTKKYNTATRYGVNNGGNSGLDSLAIKMRSGQHKTRNKRSVWKIATKPYKGAHFAVFPQEIPKTCLLAGSAAGDMILDPFSGSGTTGIQAVLHERSYTGIELNPQYVNLSEERYKQEIIPRANLDSVFTSDLAAS